VIVGKKAQSKRRLVHFNAAIAVAMFGKKSFGTLHNDWVRLVRGKTDADFLPSVVAKR
jgi:hypothetical protein